MNNGWQKKTLGEVCEFRGGGTPSKAIDGYWSGDIPWVSPKDMKSNIVSESIDHISQEAIHASAACLIPKNSVLVVVRSGILARTVPIAITGRALTINQDLKALCPNGAVDSRFLYHLLTSQMERLLSMVSRGATVHRLTTGQLRSLDFIVPPLPEQRRIVGILDEAFEGLATAKASAEKNLQNACALFESQLKSVFTKCASAWVKKKLGDIAEVQSGGTPLVSQKSNWGGNIPWYSSGELNGLFTTDPERYLTRMGLDTSNAKLFPRGSLLIGMYDTAALKMSILDRSGAFNQAIAGVKPNNGVEMEFILHAINAMKPKLLLERRGVRQKNLSLSKIKDIEVPLPKLSEQRAALSHLKALGAETQHLQSNYEQKLAALEALKKSLLHQAFTGKL